MISGIYFGEFRYFNNYEVLDFFIYIREEIECIVYVVFKLVVLRWGKLILVDKENVLVFSKLWCKVVNEVS